jgi:hypothetical protein
MTSDGNSRPLAVIVGEGLRAFRDEKNLRQDDVAAVAREFGLKWGRSSVAALEGGTRDLKIEELFLLSFIVGRLGGWNKPLIPGREKVSLSDRQWVRSEVLLNLLGSVLVGWEDLPSEDIELETVEDRPIATGFDAKKSYAENFAIYDLIRVVVWGRSRGRARESSVAGETAYALAGRLVRPDGRPVTAELVNAISYGLWGRSPGAERDARTRERGEYETKRALQSARGHVSRELIKELQGELDRKWPEIAKLFHELNVAVRTEKGLDAWDKRTMKIVYGSAADEIVDRARSLIRRGKKDGETSG